MFIESCHLPNSDAKKKSDLEEIQYAFANILFKLLHIACVFKMYMHAVENVKLIV